MLYILNKLHCAGFSILMQVVGTMNTCDILPFSEHLRIARRLIRKECSIETSFAGIGRFTIPRKHQHCLCSAVHAGAPHKLYSNLVSFPTSIRALIRPPLQAVVRARAHRTSLAASRALCVRALHEAAKRGGRVPPAHNGREEASHRVRASFSSL